MLHRYCVLTTLAVLIVAVAVGFETTARSFTQQQLKKRLLAETVRVGRVHLKSLTEIVFSDLRIEKKRNFVLDADEVSVGIHPLRVWRKEIERLSVKNASVEYQRFRSSNIDLSLDRAQNNGRLRIARINYEKIAVYDVVSSAKTSGMAISFPDLQMQFLAGNVYGEAVIDLGAPVLEYRSRLRFSDISIVRIIDDFGFGTKIEMTGLLEGELQVAGRGAELTMLGGGFKTDDPGGKLIVKDRRLLENIVDRAYLETVVETLQDYDYNAGGLAVNMENNDLVADIQLDGPKGKRSFKVVYHR